MNKIPRTTFKRNERVTYTKKKLNKRKRDIHKFFPIYSSIVVATAAALTTPTRGI